MRVQGSLTIDGVLAVPIEAYTFSVTGAIAVATGKSRIYLEGDYVVETVRAAVNTPPTGAALVVDVNKNGTTIYADQAKRPTIAAGANSATGNNPDVTTLAAGDYLTPWRRRRDTRSTRSTVRDVAGYFLHGTIVGSATPAAGR